MVLPRTEKGKPYRIHCRKYKTLDAPEEVILDENQLAANESYFSLSSIALNPSLTHLAWTQDVDGGERFELFVKELASGEIDSHQVTGLKWSLAWGDNRTLFTPKVIQRSVHIKSGVIGTQPDTDQLVWEEPDERFFLGFEVEMAAL